MTKYRTIASLEWPHKTALLMKGNGLTAKNEYYFRHMLVSRPDSSGVFRVAIDCCCNSSPGRKDKRNGDKRLCQVARRPMDSGVCINRNDAELRSACSGFRDQADFYRII